MTGPKQERLTIDVSADVYRKWHDAVNEMRYQRKVARNNSDVLNMALAALREKFGLIR